ncbi:threonine--tRNA ligase [Candidatus Dependentiae bacterium]|nr:threonine--tRNA ligase [Candidatus Dependentiae bacterium]
MKSWSPKEWRSGRIQVRNLFGTPMKYDNDLAIIRHSASHLLAQAVLELFPGTQLTIGPATADGFFQDFLPAGRNFKEEDLPLIEARMHALSAKNLPITHTQMTKEEARKLFAGNRFKLELIDGIDSDTVGIAKQGDFIDLCAGGHVASTGEIKHFKIQAISGSYWRADRNGQPLQRISGTAFWTAQELEEYERLRLEAQLYDHRRLGKQLDLFSFQEEGVGFPFFHPRGKAVLNTLMAYMRSLHNQFNYQEVSTPILLNDCLWRQSGHYAHYKDNMYFTKIDEGDYAVKPMNCPGSILIFKDRPRSYREMPLKLAEFGLVHRHELSGVLHGLLRVRSFTQDDAHIYCTVAQLEQEVGVVIQLIQNVLRKFGFTKTKFAVSTRPAKAMGSQELWDHATKALTNALEKLKIPYVIQEGEGAFYGPKIEVKIEDSLQREWQLSTCQVDFFMPENFDIAFINAQGAKERPVVIHQAIYGSFERFFAILLEHFKGNLPFWVAPIQIKVLPITDEQKAYAHTIAQQLKKAGIRVEIDESSDPLSAQIKTAQLQKIPWMLIIGSKEMAANTVTIRYRDGKQEQGMTLAQLQDKIATEMA